MSIDCQIVTLRDSKEIVQGAMVAVDWPRTRWDHRRGLALELRLERGQRPNAFVLLDGMAVLFPMDHLRRV